MFTMQLFDKPSGSIMMLRSGHSDLKTIDSFQHNSLITPLTNIHVHVCIWVHPELLTLNVSSTQRTSALLQLLQQLFALLFQLGGETQVDGKNFTQGLLHRLPQRRAVQGFRTPRNTSHTRHLILSAAVPGPLEAVWRGPTGLSCALFAGVDRSRRPWTHLFGPDGVSPHTESDTEGTIISEWFPIYCEAISTICQLTGGPPGWTYDARSWDCIFETVHQCLQAAAQWLHLLKRAKQFAKYYD